MVKVYTGKPISNKIFRILNRQLGIPPYLGKKPYRAIFDEMDFSFIEVIETPAEADFLLIPHSYFSVQDNKTYIDQFVALAKRYNKRIIVFAYGDNEDDSVIPHATIFRYSGYRYRGVNENEIIMPTQIYAGDILEEPFLLRDRQDKPVVSFCGWAGFSSWKEWLRYISKIIPLDIKKYVFFNTHADVYKQGVYWRKKAIKALIHSSLLKTSFLIRNFYAANKYTIQGDPEVLRKEYIQNITDSDFVLVARGDSNMAVRFYETLALGRIPVVIDTEWVLPLEDIIDYKKFVVFVPYTDIKNADKYIRKFWDSLSDEEFKKRQKLARETFMKYLKFDSFLKFIFETKLKR